MEYIKLISKEALGTVSGIKITKDTELEYKTETIEQTIKDLTLRTVTKVEGEGYKGFYDMTVELNEGDYLIFEEEGRGYIKPLNEFITIEEAKEELDK